MSSQLFKTMTHVCLFMFNNMVKSSFTTIFVAFHSNAHYVSCHQSLIFTMLTDNYLYTPNNHKRETIKTFCIRVGVENGLCGTLYFTERVQ